MRARAGAAAALLTGLSHLPLAAEHRAAAPLVALVLLAMAAGCLHCGVALWRRPSRWAWLLAGSMSALMVMAHGPLHALVPMTGTARGGGLADSPLLAAVGVTAEVLLLALAATALLRRGARLPVAPAAELVGAAR